MKTLSIKFTLLLMVALLISSVSVSAEKNYTQKWISESTEINYFDLSENNKLRYLKTGSGKPLLLLHTIRTQLDYFEKMIPELSKHFTVYALDLPGHGYSSTVDADYTEPYFREAVVQFIETMNLKELTIVGESIGGVLALTASIETANRIKQVYSFNPYDYGDSYGGGIRRSSAWGNLIIGSFGVHGVGAVSSRMGNRFVLRRIFNGGLSDNDKLSDELLLEFNDIGRRKGYNRVTRSTFSNWQSWLNARSLYQHITVPVTLIYGEQDWSLPTEREANATLLNGANTITLNNAGHFSSLDQTKQIINIIVQGSVE